ncbi:MAG: ABC transporter substrate-binding protein, partial [Nitrospirales bacterium]
LEAVLTEDPEVIIFPVGSVEGIPESEQRQWDRWTTLSAVKAHRLHHVDSDLVNRPGPRIVQGLEALARILHPQAPQGQASSGTK